MSRDACGVRSQDFEEGSKFPLISEQKPAKFGGFGRPKIAI